MKRIFGLFAAIFLSTNLALAADTVTIGAEDDWAPYSGQEGGTPKGFTVELVKEVFKTQGIDVKYVSLPFARCMEEVKQAKLMACFNHAWDEKEDPAYTFHKDPMFIGEIGLYAPTSSTESGLTTKDLEGKTIGTTHGYTYGAAFDENKKIIKDVAKQDVLNVKKVAAGRLKYTAIYTRVFDDIIRRNPDMKGKLKQIGTVHTHGLWTAFSKGMKDSSKYVEAFNKGLAEVKKNGTYAKLEQKYK